MSQAFTLSNVEALSQKADPIPVTVLVPVWNEAGHLSRCLEALNQFKEVFVIDSQSTDATVEIAAKHGAKVAQFHYQGGWPKKRQWALDSLPIGSPWVLLLDADEIVTPELANEIRCVIKADSHDGHWLCLNLTFLGGQLRHGDVSFWKLSLFRKRCGRFECRLRDQDDSMADFEVHEHVVCTAVAVNSKTHCYTKTWTRCHATFASTISIPIGNRESCLARKQLAS
jgi:glycosyltransferase involved in cell wall biosynthesis